MSNSAERENLTDKSLIGSEHTFRNLKCLSIVCIIVSVVLRAVCRNETWFGMDGYVTCSYDDLTLRMMHGPTPWTVWSGTFKTNSVC